MDHSQNPNSDSSYGRGRAYGRDDVPASAYPPIQQPYGYYRGNAPSSAQYYNHPNNNPIAGQSNPPYTPVSPTSYREQTTQYSDDANYVHTPQHRGERYTPQQPHYPSAAGQHSGSQYFSPYSYASALPPLSSPAVSPPGVSPPGSQPYLTGDYSAQGHGYNTSRYTSPYLAPQGHSSYEANPSSRLGSSNRAPVMEEGEVPENDNPSTQAERPRLEKTHRCAHDGCSKKFATTNDRERHGRSVHGEDGQYFQCRQQGCSEFKKYFARRDNFVDHLKRMHKFNRQPESQHREYASNWISMKQGDTYNHHGPDIIAGS